MSLPHMAMGLPASQPQYLMLPITPSPPLQSPTGTLSSEQLAQYHYAQQLAQMQLAQAQQLAMAQQSYLLGHNVLGGLPHQLTGLDYGYMPLLPQYHLPYAPIPLPSQSHSSDQPLQQLPSQGVAQNQLQLPLTPLLQLGPQLIPNPEQPLPAQPLSTHPGSSQFVASYGETQSLSQSTGNTPLKTEGSPLLSSGPLPTTTGTDHGGATVPPSHAPAQEQQQPASSQIPISAEEPISSREELLGAIKPESVEAEALVSSQEEGENSAVEVPSTPVAPKVQLTRSKTNASPSKPPDISQIPKPFLCPMADCGRRYGSKTALRNHWRAKHSEHEFPRDNEPMKGEGPPAKKRRLNER